MGNTNDLSGKEGISRIWELKKEMMVERMLRPVHFVFLLLLFLSFTVTAQDRSSAEKVVIGGKKYLLYTVKKGDTPYSIIKAFNITPDQFEAANPELKGSIIVGQNIKIPFEETTSQLESKAEVPPTVDSDNFIYHSAENKETLYSISKKYKVSVDELNSYNPGLKDGLQVKEIVKIPKHPKSNEVLPQEKTILHKVGKGETLYSIAKKYNTTQEAILDANPEIKSTIKKGTTIRIPAVQNEKTVVAATANATDLLDYRLESGDTYYNLEKRFGVSEEELKRYNPQLTEGLKTGMVINIPKKSDAEKAETESKVNEKQVSEAGTLSGFNNSAHQKGKKYNVGLFLPFSAAVDDTVKTSQRTTNFLGFYQGTLLAVDSLVKEGMNIKLYVYDTWQDPAIVEKLVKNPEFLSLDLIIGPVYPEAQKIISELSAKNRIPMVSPLSPDEVYVSKNPYFFQVNPGKKLRLTTTADYVASQFRNENIIVINRSNGGQDNKIITERLQEKFSNEGTLAPNLHFYNIWLEGSGGLENLLKPEKPNIIVLAETNEANVSTAMNRLNSLAKKFPVTVIGIQEYTRLQSIDTEILHNVSFRYLAPYFIDYTTPQVNNFIGAYRREFGTEPSQFSFQGYDATTYFIRALDQSAKATNGETGVINPGLLQADYHFQKVSDFGGFMNHSFFVIEYSPSFDVQSVGKIDGN